MATNNDSFQGDGTSFLSRFASVSIGLGAVGGAGYKLWERTNNNRPIKSVNDLIKSVDRSGTALGGVLKEVGKNVKSQAVKHAHDETVMAAELANSLSKGDYLRKISETVEQTNALLNSVLTTIDDPNTGMDRVLSPSVRDEIINLMQRLAENKDPNALRQDMEQVVGGFMSALAGGPEKNRVVWARHLNESKGIAQDLIAPQRVSGTSKVHRGFISLDEAFDDAAFKGLSNQTKDRIRESMGRLNTKRLGGNVQIVADGEALYAQVLRSRGKTGSELVYNYPLHLGKKLNNSPISRSPMTYRTSRNLDFGWRYGRGAVDAVKLQDIVGQAGGIGMEGIPVALAKHHRTLLDDVRQEALVSSNPLDVIERRIIQAGGNKKSLRRMNSRQWLEYLQKTSHLQAKDLPTLHRAFISTEEMLQNVLLDNIGVTGNTSINALDPRKLAEEAQSLGIPNSRVTGEADGALGRHVKHAYKKDQNFLKVINMEKVSEVFNQRILREFNANPYMDPSASPGRLLHTTKIGNRNRVTADVGLFGESSLASIQFSGRGSFFDEGGARTASDVLLRSYMPKPARLEQITGRPRMFGGPVLEANHGIKFGASAATGWDASVTGTTNKAFLMVAEPDKIEDNAAAFFKKLEGLGQVYHTGEEVLIEQEAFKILDPQQSKKGMGRLLAAASGGQPIDLQFRDGAYWLGDERLGTFIGYDNRNKQVSVRADPDTIGATFRLERHTVKNNKGKDVDNIVGIMTKSRRMPQYKGFSTQHKGMFAQVADDVMTADLDHIGATPLVDLLGKTLGTGSGALRKHLAYGTSDTVKKAHLFWDQQITSAFQMLGGDTKELKKRATGYAKGSKFADDILGGVVRAALELGSESGIDAKGMGHVLAGVASKSFREADKNPLLSIINKSSFAGSKEFQEALASRIFFGMSAVAAGEGVGDYGTARASLDKRQVSVFATRLKAMGLDDKNTKSIMSDLVGRMDYAADSATTAKGLMGLVREAKGLGSMTKALDRTSVVGVNQLFQMMGDDTLEDFLSNQNSPIRLSFAAQDGASVSDRQIATAAAKILGTEAITLPTGSNAGDLLEAMRGTVIKEGEAPAKQVAGEFTSDLGQLLGYLRKYMGSPIEVPQDELENAFSTWQDDLIHLASKAQAGALSGKVKGSMMLPILSYDMSELGGAKGLSTKSFGLKSSQVDYIQKAQELTNGRAVFLDDQAFLGTLRQYSGVSAKDAAKKAERFFLGSYGMSTKGHLQGISAFAVRQPVLGAGHVAPVQMFRHLGSEAGNEIFQRFKALTGDKYSQFSGWHDLAHYDHSRQPVYDASGKVLDKGGLKAQFFADFIQHLDAFAGTAGGSSYAPRMLRTRDVYINDAKQSAQELVDFGIQAIMGADNDGDHVAYILANGAHSKVLEAGIRGDAFNAMDNMYKESWAAYGIASKNSLKELQARNVIPGTDEIQRQYETIMQDVQKESAQKTATGQLDVRLNNLRMSAMDLALQEGDSDLGKRVTRLTGMLAAVQEHTLLKSKKVPLYFPFAEYLGDAVNTAMNTDNVDPLESVLRNNIFGAWKGSIRVGDTTINIDEDLATLRQVVAHAKSAGWGEDVSAGALAAKLSSRNIDVAREALDSIEAGAGITGSYVRGFAGDTADSLFATAHDFGSRVSKAASSLNMGHGTTVGLGLMAAGVGLSIFGSSYSSQPLTSVYDRPRPEIAGSIRDQSALQPSSQSLSTPGNAYAMMPRGINERATYIGQQNAFQVRGTVNNRADVDNVMSVLRLGPLGSGHVTVGLNDNRRPITQNYVDRMLGAY